MPRRLGQHFLRTAAARRLVGVIEPGADDVFLEIGAGSGALTLPLAERCRRIVGVELDAALARGLRKRAPANVEVVEGDALALDLAALLPKGGRVAGNLPYYVSSPLLRRVLELHAHARDAHLMVQDEVARRVASPPGSRDYGILSVLFALWSDVTIVQRFPPGSFSPPPKVASAVLRIAFRDRPRAEIPSPAAFETLVRTAFARRRRTLENNLQDSYPNLKHNLRLLNIAGSRRAETLSVVEFASLARGLVLE